MWNVWAVVQCYHSLYWLLSTWTFYAWLNFMHSKWNSDINNVYSIIVHILLSCASQNLTVQIRPNLSISHWFGQYKGFDDSIKIKSLSNDTHRSKWWSIALNALNIIKFQWFKQIYTLRIKLIHIEGIILVLLLLSSPSMFCCCWCCVSFHEEILIDKLWISMNQHKTMCSRCKFN